MHYTLHLIGTVHDQDQPRGFWKIDKVEALIARNDGSTRGAVLRVANKGGKTTTLQRPVQLIYPLGVTQTQPELEPETEPKNPIPDDASNHPTHRATHPKRDSALRARDQVKAWTSELMEEDEPG